MITPRSPSQSLVVLGQSQHGNINLFRFIRKSQARSHGLVSSIFDS
mgnify:FL=1|jgi:hypothetical protein